MTYMAITNSHIHIHTYIHTHIISSNCYVKHIHTSHAYMYVLCICTHACIYTCNAHITQQQSLGYAGTLPCKVEETNVC